MATLAREIKERGVPCRGPSPCDGRSHSVSVSRGDCLIPLACSHRGTRSHTQCGPCAPWGICRYLLVAWLLLLLSWLLLRPAQPRGWRLISIQSQALPRCLNRPARLRRLRAPRCLQILPALTASSPAWRGAGAKHWCRVWAGRTGQDPPQEEQARISFSPAARQMAAGWAVGEDDGPSGPSALSGHTEEPPSITLCGLVATLWWGKAWEGWLGCKALSALPPTPSPKQAWERSNSWDAIWMGQGPHWAGGCWAYQLRMYSDPAAFPWGGNELFFPHGQQDPGTPPSVPVNRRGVFGLGEGLLVKAQGQERMGMAFS